eukprot:gene14264-biopygen11720
MDGWMHEESWTRHQDGWMDGCMHAYMSRGSSGLIRQCRESAASECLSSGSAVPPAAGVASRGRAPPLPIPFVMMMDGWIARRAAEEAPGGMDGWMDGSHEGSLKRRLAGQRRVAWGRRLERSGSVWPIEPGPGIRGSASRSCWDARQAGCRAPPVVGVDGWRGWNEDCRDGWRPAAARLLWLGRTLNIEGSHGGIPKNRLNVSLKGPCRDTEGSLGDAC